MTLDDKVDVKTWRDFMDINGAKDTKLFKYRYQFGIHLKYRYQADKKRKQKIRTNNEE